MLFPFEPKLGHADKDVTQFSVEELKQFKQLFTRRQRNRWWFVPLCYLGLISAWVIWIGLLYVTAQWLKVGPELNGLMVFLYVLGSIGLTVGYKRLIQPRCPACSSHVDRTVGPFCPSCGTRGLDYNSNPRCPTCHALIKWYHWGTYRPDFKIHACSVCGVWLRD